MYLVIKSLNDHGVIKQTAQPKLAKTKPGTVELLRNRVRLDCVSSDGLLRR